MGLGDDRFLRDAFTGEKVDRDYGTFGVHRFRLDRALSRPWTLLGLSATNLPAWRRPDGLPVGVQLIGTRRDGISYLENLALAEAALTNPVAPTEQTKINSKED